MSTPQQKRAAGKGVVGYLRVSAAGQVDGWSLDRQEAAIRTWATAQALPIIAIEVAPDGNESGATAFADRVGWQAVERHIATGRVGWIAVATVDRLSRTLGDLADRVRSWNEQDIAIVAPAQGFDQSEGIGTFLLHLWGLMADHERKRLLGRIIPGMQARLQAGLPLGRLPLGYRVAVDAPVAGQRPRRHLQPDLATAPIIAALFQQAVAQPAWGDRRLAAWAAHQWPHLSWSVGRVSGILTNRVYLGELRGRVTSTEVVYLDHHPPLVAAGDFERIQAVRSQRARDHQDGMRAAGVTSWMGGLVHCGCCGGRVTWRSAGYGSDPPRSGSYVCTGSGCAGPAAPAAAGCGATWPLDIETFVWRGIECLLERAADALVALADAAVERVPGLLDERRRCAQADLDAADGEVVRLTGDLEANRLPVDAYATAIRAMEHRRTRARALLQEVDGWTYLARLILVREGEHGGGWRRIPFRAMIMHLDSAERRRLLRAVAARIVLQDPARIGSLGGVGEAPELGRFTGVTFERTRAGDAASALAVGLSRLLVHRPGWDVAPALRVTGWEEIRTPVGRQWRHRATGQIIGLADDPIG